jgi:hypothetical protein
MMTKTDSWNDEQYELYSENVSTSVAPPAADKNYSASPQSSGFDSVSTGRFAPNLASFRALRQLEQEELNEYEELGELQEKFD